MDIELPLDRRSKSVPKKRKASIRKTEDVDLTVTGSGITDLEEAPSVRIKEEKVEQRTIVINPVNFAANRKVTPTSLNPAQQSQKRLQQTAPKFPVRKLRRDSKQKIPSRPATPEVAAPAVSRLHSKSKPLQIIAEITDDSQENIEVVQQVAQVLQQSDSPSLERFQRSHVLLENQQSNLIQQESHEVIQPQDGKKPSQVSEVSRQNTNITGSENDETEPRKEVQRAVDSLTHNRAKARQNSHDRQKQTSVDVTAGDEEAIPSKNLTADDEEASMDSTTEDEEAIPSVLERSVDSDSDSRESSEEDSANRSSSHLGTSASVEITQNTPKQSNSQRSSVRKSLFQNVEPSSLTDGEEVSEIEWLEDHENQENSREDSGVSDTNAETTDESILYDPYKRGCKRPGLRVRKVTHPYWINDGTAKQYKVSYGVHTEKEGLKMRKARKLMKELKVTDCQMKTPSFMSLSAKEVIRRVKAIAKERKRIPKRLAR